MLNDLASSFDSGLKRQIIHSSMYDNGSESAPKMGGKMGKEGPKIWAKMEKDGQR